MPAAKKVNEEKNQFSRENISYSFALTADVHNKVKQRIADLNKNPGSKKSAAQKPDELAILKQVSLFKNDMAKKKNYIAGPGKGQHVYFVYQNVSFKVRLDKEQQKFYPRVSVSLSENDKSKNDKTTLALAKLLSQPAASAAYKKYFLLALQGNNYLYDQDEDDDMSEENAKQAFKDGLEVRFTVLISDLLDYPGNSVITAILLSKTTAENYPDLFLGGRYEGSYGALPSQNQNPKHEDKLERVTAYKTIGELIVNGGNTKLTSVKSNIFSLRKINSLVKFAPELLTVHKIVKGNHWQKMVQLTVAEFDQDIRSLTIQDRHQKFQKTMPKFEVLSDPEDSSGDESAKYSVLDEQALQEMDQALQKKLNKLLKKRNKIQELLSSKRKSSATDSAVSLSAKTLPKKVKKIAAKHKKVTANSIVTAAHHYGFSSWDVPKDGLCFYHAVMMQLKKQTHKLNINIENLGINSTKDTDFSGNASKNLMNYSSGLRKLVCDHIMKDLQTHSSAMNDSLPITQKRTESESDEAFAKRYKAYILNKHDIPFADEFEIRILAEILNITIVIITDKKQLQFFHNYTHSHTTIYIGNETNFHFRSLHEDEEPESAAKRQVLENLIKNSQEKGRKISAKKQLLSQFFQPGLGKNPAGFFNNNQQKITATAKKSSTIPKINPKK